ncbi:MAG: DUF1801 domain-containing protein [Usitatibacteraceae bacterium]
MSSALLENYLADVPSAHQKALRLLHDIIMMTIPQIDLVMRRNVPAFQYRGRTLVSIGNAKHHVSLYIMQGATITNHAAELGAFDFTRTVVRFNPDQIPTGLVAQLLLARAAEMDRGEKVRADKRRAAKV